MPKLDITSQERSALRAAAHPLRPVVLIGDRGLTESVLNEIDRNLKAHQLIKVRVAGDDREARGAMLETICETLSCATVHHLGKTLIIYRPDPDARVSPLAPRKPAEAPTRAVRKPTEPHTPKKLAATGQTITRRDEKARKAVARKAAADDAPVAVPERAPRNRIPARGAAAPRIPRRSGSALSLRAGLRRGR